jgi:hypothetical protein
MSSFSGRSDLAPFGIRGVTITEICGCPGYHRMSNVRPTDSLTGFLIPPWVEV